MIHTRVVTWIFRCVNVNGERKEKQKENSEIQKKKQKRRKDRKSTQMSLKIDWGFDLKFCGRY